MQKEFSVDLKPSTALGGVVRRSAELYGQKTGVR